MMKSLKIYIVAFLIAAVGASAVFCCCIEKLVKAHAVKRSAAASCCHGDKASDEKAAAPCACTFKKFGIAETEAVGAATVAFLPHGGAVDAVFVSVDQLFQVALTRTAYGGAPLGSRYSVPLYLQHRSLLL